MKLELKHLAGYLPYGLKYKDIPDGFDGIRELDIQTFDWCLENGKPILRPLLDLTKEIEVDGDKFVPIDVIGEDVEINICDCDYISDWCERGGNFLDYLNEFIEQKYGNHHLNFLPFGFIQKLLKWHFDIYGLIPAGLAIDINTLK